ncbi:hypothetical protein KsCSTR_47820 [Candidatus Kuenenia stuttgartiensis]|uniref:Uncharacterized protein n=1 Tax=Kuenenia stuttgartiensis TaxID=174633 RepID=A0A6G7GY16_KUEST|nr:hypothetical protein KsCSTR_47820 [Candidatus Kuenenia stuttgartiensis]
MQVPTGICFLRVIRALYGELLPHILSMKYGKELNSLVNSLEKKTRPQTSDFCPPTPDFRLLTSSLCPLTSGCIRKLMHLLWNCLNFRKNSPVRSVLLLQSNCSA